ncbi:MAG: hypothetical protein R3335_08125 [Anaerolineales bacterium]|nr:hypothetical protein [Anaerolineales bacterium]
MSHDNQAVIKQTEFFAREALSVAEGGHDWWHVERVRRLAGHISEQEGADLFVVELGALQHDIADAKFHQGDEAIHTFYAIPIVLNGEGLLRRKRSQRQG